MADDLDSYPHCRPWRDRHGRMRWRFRKGPRTAYLPGEPFTPEFDAAYQAVLAGRPIPKKTKKAPAPVVVIGSAVLPMSIAAAWRKYCESSPTWKSLEPITRARQTALAEEFLIEPVAEVSSAKWGDMPIADLKRRHIKMILNNMSGRPFAAAHRLVAIRKMIEAALDEEWIDHDPTHKLGFRPERIKGWRPWTDAERALFEEAHPIGTTARLVYEIAFWLGDRRSDVVALRWDQRGAWRDHEGVAHDVFRFAQRKTGREMIVPISPGLAAALDAAPRRSETVVTTQHGKPFSAKSLTGRMSKWTKKADLPPGCTIHGLRKTLGRTLAEGGATTRELMETLGHTDIAHAELYSREAEQARLAAEGIKKVIAFENRRRKADNRGG